MSNVSTSLNVISTSLSAAADVASTVALPAQNAALQFVGFNAAPVLTAFAAPIAAFQLITQGFELERSIARGRRARRAMRAARHFQGIALSQALTSLRRGAPGVAAVRSGLTLAQQRTDASKVRTGLPPISAQRQMAPRDFRFDRMAFIRAATDPTFTGVDLFGRPASPEQIVRSSVGVDPSALVNRIEGRHAAAVQDAFAAAAPGGSVPPFFERVARN